MRDTLVMKVIKCLGNLLEKLATDRLLDLAVGALLLNILVERDSRNVVSNNADLFTGFDQIIHLDDMWMVDLLQSHDFSLNGFAFH